MKITPIRKNSYQENRKATFVAPENPLNFEARMRVDKGLQRFYETNRNRMPQTFEQYISSNKNDLQGLSPMEVLKKAFEFLNLTETIKDIKDIFPLEPLFAKLKTPFDTKAHVGILKLIKEYSEQHKDSNEGILKNKENFTVYLVKKIFLENKTIKEINQGLDRDLNEDFKTEFKAKYPNTDFIHHSTLTALGISGGSLEYRHSLRYTNEEYADAQGEKVSLGLQNFWGSLSPEERITQGEKVSQGLQNFWESLSPEERTTKAEKSVERFEKWWASFSKEELLEMIAKQTSELEMLALFKESKDTNEQFEKVKNTNTTRETTKKVYHPIKTGSDSLKKDELFIKWASNNLKIFLANLSDREKEAIRTKQAEALTNRWAEMTPAERTEYISKIRAGIEPQRFTMIEAWNNSPNIIKDLYTHLKLNQVYKLSEFIYAQEEFSKSQSEIMTEFWEKHPEHAKTLGKNIAEASTKINQAIEMEAFNVLKKQILEDKAQRIKAFEQVKIEMAPTIDKYRLAKLERFARDYFIPKKDISNDELINELAKCDIYYIEKMLNENNIVTTELKKEIYENIIQKQILNKLGDKYYCTFEYADDFIKQEEELNQNVALLTRNMKILPKEFIKAYTTGVKVLMRKDALTQSLFKKHIKTSIKPTPSPEFKLATTSMELILGKLLRYMTKDIAVMDLDIQDSLALINSIINSNDTAFPRRIRYKSGDETRHCMLYTKPEVIHISTSYYSTYKLLDKFMNNAPSCDKENLIKEVDKIIRIITRNHPKNDELKGVILEKLGYLSSEE